MSVKQPHRSARWPTGPEREAETIAHLRSENARLQELADRAVAQMATYFVRIHQLHAVIAGLRKGAA